MKKTAQLFYFILKNLSGFIFLSAYSVFPQHKEYTPKTFDILQIERAKKMLDTSPEGALEIYQQLLPKFLEEKDSNKIITCYVGISDIHKNKGEYYMAYRKLWDAQLLAEKTSDTIPLIQIHQDLAVLYSIYNRYTDAQIHLNKSIKLLKQKMNSEKLAVMYFSMAVVKSSERQFNAALKYLDSIRLLRPNQTTQMPYVDTQKGYIYKELGDFNKSQFYLEQGHRYFVKNEAAYGIISGLFLGDLYIKLKRWNEAKESLNYSVELLKKTHNHGDKKAEILKKLSFTYEKLGQLKKAYTLLDRSVQTTDSLFNTKKTINSQLFQINNTYEASIRKKNQQIKDQSLTIERMETSRSRFRLISGFSIFFVMVIVLSIWVRLKYLKLEKEKILGEQEKEKANEKAEIKSRELTSNVLQLIDKENIIKKLLEELKDKSPNSYAIMKRRASINDKDMWERFNKRFIEVNMKFYEDLRKKHPNLTVTEQKHCALIKLKFDGKEMASILNISLNGVHVSRHRIRKKLELQKDQSLENYIADI